MGATVQLCLVTIEHTISTERGEAIREEQDLIYLGAVQPRAASAELRQGAEGASLPPPDLVRSVEASPVLLFRFSALTLNSHRIHYDRHYATEVEGYPGLVVHGPLQAALLLELAGRMRISAGPDQFQFRAVRPFFDTGSIRLAGRWRHPNAVELTSGPEGRPSVVATALWQH